MPSELLNNPAIFSQVSACPIINGEITLFSNTWEMHIKSKHPEVADSLQQIQNTIANPAYVAASRPGPGAVHADNVVLVSRESRIRSATLHVFVESPKTRPTVSSAMFLKSRHASVLWENPEDIRASYDRDADVLYVSKSEPVPALVEEEDDGLLFRYALSDDQPCGVTVMSFHHLWHAHKAVLINRISEFLKVPHPVAERAVLSADSTKRLR